MGYYIRILTESDKHVEIQDITGYLAYLKLKATIINESDIDKPWSSIVLSHLDEEPICFIERNVVKENSIGFDELNEFIEDIHHYKPASAVKWLEGYFQKVKTIYAFQILSGTERKHGWEILGAVKDLIWSILGGIIQADNEGFSNEEGFHILWQFDDDVKGDWNMTVIDEHGNWKNFKMDLGNKIQRAAFLEGRIPPKVKIINDV